MHDHSPIVLSASTQQLPHFFSKVPASLLTPPYKSLFLFDSEILVDPKLGAFFPIAIDFWNKVSPYLSLGLFLFDKRKDLTLISKHRISEL